MHEDKGALERLFVITSAGILFVLLVLSLYSNLPLHFFLVILPAYLVFLAAYHFKRFLGSIVFSVMFLLFFIFLTISTLFNPYLVLTDIFFLIMVIFSALQIVRIPRSKNIRVERIISLGVNAVIYIILVFSFLLPYSKKTSLSGMVLSLYAMLGMVVLFPLICMISAKFLRLKMVISDNMLNLALSMLAWGAVGLLFYWLLDLSVACGCYCEYPIFLGHYLFTTVMLTTGSAILTMRIATNNMGGDKSE